MDQTSYLLFENASNSILSRWSCWSWVRGVVTMSKMQGTVERDKFGKCKFADLSVLGYILYEGYNIYVFQTYDKFEKNVRK